MNPRLPVLAASILAAGAIAVFGYFLTVPPPGPARAQNFSGRELYVANCAKYHGLNLEGQPNWMTRNEDGRLPAPPHDESGHTWHHSDSQLFMITKFGLQAIVPGYETDMPAFEHVLPDAEITLVLEYIKSTWPERPKAYQAERSNEDPQS